MSKFEVLSETLVTDTEQLTIRKKGPGFLSVAFVTDDEFKIQELGDDTIVDLPVGKRLKLILQCRPRKDSTEGTVDLEALRDPPKGC